MFALGFAAGLNFEACFDYFVVLLFTWLCLCCGFGLLALRVLVGYF